MNTKSPDKLPAEANYSDDILKAVGVLILTAALAEHSVTLQILKLLGHSEEDEAVVWIPLQGMGIRTKIRIVKVCAALGLQDHKQAIDKCCDALEGAFGKRHLFAHGMPSARAQNNRIAVYSGKFSVTGDYPQPESVTAEEIRGYAMKIHECMLNLDEALTEAAGQQS